MTSKQRAYLKGIAQTTNAIFQIGKSNLTPEVTSSIAEYFNAHEIVKITVLKNATDNPNAMAQMLAERTGSEVVQVIGRKIVLYKPDKDNPKIILPR